MSIYIGTFVIDCNGTLNETVNHQNRENWIELDKLD